MRPELCKTIRKILVNCIREYVTVDAVLFSPLWNLWVQQFINVNLSTNMLILYPHYCITQVLKGLELCHIVHIGVYVKHLLRCLNFLWRLCTIVLIKRMCIMLVWIAGTLLAGGHYGIMLILKCLDFTKNCYFCNYKVSFVNWVWWICFYLE